MKKTVSAILSAAMLVTAISAAGFTAAEPSSISASESSVISSDLLEAMESSENTKLNVWIWLKDSNKPDFDALVEEKISPKTAEEAEKFYALSEYDLTELRRTTGQEMIQEYYSSMNRAFADTHSISQEDLLFVSKETPSMKCNLTPEQIKLIAADEKVKSISLNEYEVPTEVPTKSDEAPKLTKKEFLDIVISENSDLSDGGFIWRGDLKFDAIEKDGSYDLIVYGIKQEDYTPGVNVSSEAVKYGSEIYSCSSSPAFYSGVVTYVDSTDERLPENQRHFYAIFYVNNVLPGYMNLPKTLVDASVNAPYDLAQYIYPEIIPGDADGDGTVDASDASQVLMAYSYRSVGKKLPLNDTIFDYNNDGTIDSNDASAILAFYSKQLTTAPDDVYVEYHFRTKELLEQHFQKHGSEFVGDFNYVTAVDYEKGASDVINNDTALFKTEAEDGDGVYYIENTNEFVILSTDGYIRTYFRPTAGIDYFNKQ